MFVIRMVLVFRLDGGEMCQDFVVGEDGVLRFEYLREDMSEVRWDVVEGCFCVWMSVRSGR